MFGMLCFVIFIKKIKKQSFSWIFRLYTYIRAKWNHLSHELSRKIIFLLTDVMSNLRTSFKYAGMLVRNVYVIQLAHVCVMIIPQKGALVRKRRQGISICTETKYVHKWNPQTNFENISKLARTDSLQLPLYPFPVVYLLRHFLTLIFPSVRLTCDKLTFIVEPHDVLSCRL